MKIYTCTPVPFKGDHTFFNRDSGLFCKAFQAIGVESKAIMPLPAQEGDWPDLIRTDYKNLDSVAWWKSLELDGVVLYAWSLPKYTKIARAIHESGAKLVLYLDSGASIYPWMNWLFWTKLIFRKNWFAHPNSHILWGALTVVRAHTLSIANSLRRRRHLGYADIVGVPIPSAVVSHKRIPLLMTADTRSRIVLMPAPIASHFKYNPLISKEDIIIMVGRWNDEEQKRPRYMMQAIEEVCRVNPSSTFHIFGSMPDFMTNWHQGLPPEWRKRITLHGIVKSEVLADYYQKAQICLCPSMHESTHLASAEAVCCGCSVVVPPCPSLAAIHWYASAQSGTIATKDTPASCAEAIEYELESWDNGGRDPERISAHWAGLLHAQNTVRTIIAHF